MNMLTYYLYKIKIYKTVLCIIHGYIIESNSIKTWTKVLFHWAPCGRNRELYFVSWSIFYIVFLSISLLNALLCLHFLLGGWTEWLIDWLIFLLWLIFAKKHQEKYISHVGQQCSWGTRVEAAKAAEVREKPKVLISWSSLQLSKRKIFLCNHVRSLKTTWNQFLKLQNISPSATCSVTV